VQRKILWVSSKNDATDESEIPVYVSQLSGKVSFEANYRHGEKSLHEAIVGMAQGFVGSNNIPLLTPYGNFGSHAMNGSDAASPHYISVKLEPITRKIFVREDDALLKYLTDGNASIEPAFYCPVIPMILVNGTSGAGGVGWHSSVPRFDPRDVIANCRRWMPGENHAKLEEMKPSYSGFKGRIEKTNVEGEWLMSGYAEVDGLLIRIMEIPVGMSAEDLYKRVNSLPKDNKSDGNPPIHTIRTVNNVYFQIKVTEKQKEYIVQQGGIDKFFGLTKIIRCRQMVLFGPQGKLKVYDCITDVFEDFGNVRLQMYSDRKASILSSLRRRFNQLANEIRFINDSFAEEFRNLPLEELLKALEEKGYMKIPENGEDSDAKGRNLTTLYRDYEHLVAMSTHGVTGEQRSAAEKERLEIKKKMEAMKKKSPPGMWVEDLDAVEKALAERGNPEGVCDWPREE
jgi:DNA topoisomerase-2